MASANAHRFDRAGSSWSWVRTTRGNLLATRRASAMPASAPLQPTTPSASTQGDSSKPRIGCSASTPTTRNINPIKPMTRYENDGKPGAQAVPERVARDDATNHITADCPRHQVVEEADQLQLEQTHERWFRSRAVGREQKSPANCAREHDCQQ